MLARAIWSSITSRVALSADDRFEGVELGKRFLAFQAWRNVRGELDSRTEATALQMAEVLYGKSALTYGGY
jgi:hypothetical protein